MTAIAVSRYVTTVTRMLLLLLMIMMMTEMTLTRGQLTGEPLVHRADDDASALATRLKAFHKETQPVIDYYSKQGKVGTIDATQAMTKVSRGPSPGPTLSGCRILRLRIGTGDDCLLPVKRDSTPRW
jgi:adenylate kinase family enzyme